MSDAAGNRAFIAMGTNIDPASNLIWAVERISRLGTLLAASRVFETTPVGFADQPNFLNAAVLLETPLSAEELIVTALPAIENDLGRRRDPRNPNGPRTIDLDLALFNDRSECIAGHTIPDPDILDRAFLAVNLSDLVPDYVHPTDGRTLATITEKLLVGETGMTLRPDVRLMS